MTTKSHLSPSKAYLLPVIIMIVLGLVLFLLQAP